MGFEIEVVSPNPGNTTRSRNRTGKKMNEHERDACIHYYKWTWNITEEPRDGLGRIGISGKNCKHHYQARIVRRLKYLGVVVSFNHQ